MPSIYLESYPLGYSHDAAGTNTSDRDRMKERLFTSQEYLIFLQEHQISSEKTRPQLWEKRGNLYFVFSRGDRGENWVEIPKNLKNIYGEAYFILRGYYPEENWRQQSPILKPDFPKIPSPLSLNSRALQKKGNSAPVKALSAKKLEQYRLPSLDIRPISLSGEKSAPLSPIVIFGSPPNKGVNETEEDEISESASFHEELAPSTHRRPLHSLNNREDAFSPIGSSEEEESLSEFEEESPTDYTSRSDEASVLESEESFASEEEESLSESEEESPTDYTPRSDGASVFESENSFASEEEEESLTPIVVFGATPNISPRLEESGEEEEFFSQSPSLSSEDVESSSYTPSEVSSSVDSGSIDGNNPATPTESETSTSRSSSPFSEEDLQESYELYNRPFLFLEENPERRKGAIRSNSPLTIQVVEDEDEDDEASSHFLSMVPLSNPPPRRENRKNTQPKPTPGPQNSLPPSLKHLFPPFANRRPSTPRLASLRRKPPLLLTNGPASSHPPLTSSSPQETFQNSHQSPLRRLFSQFINPTNSRLPFFSRTNQPPKLLNGASAPSSPIPLSLKKELAPPTISSPAPSAPSQKKGSSSKTYSSFAREMVYGTPFKKGRVYSPKTRKKPADRLTKKEAASLLHWGKFRLKKPAPLRFIPPLQLISFSPPLADQQTLTPTPEVQKNTPNTLWQGKTAEPKVNVTAPQSQGPLVLANRVVKPALQAVKNAPKPEKCIIM